MADVGKIVFNAGDNGVKTTKHVDGVEYGSTRFGMMALFPSRQALEKIAQTKPKGKKELFRQT